MNAAVPFTRVAMFARPAPPALASAAGPDGRRGEGLWPSKARGDCGGAGVSHGTSAAGDSRILGAETSDPYCGGLPRQGWHVAAPTSLRDGKLTVDQRVRAGEKK
jgi:hypothetical protein